MKNKEEGPWYWLSTEKMTVGVKTDDRGIIIDSAPIVKKFRGQPIDNLIRWMKKQPGFMMDISEK